jgi:hypothetical protein
MIPDIEKFLPVAIFKMTATIPHKFNIVRFIIYPHMKCRWNRTMLNLCGIVAAILKMSTGRNVSMSGIISGHHNLPTYEMSLKSDNVEFMRYCFNDISYVGRLWCPELIPDIEKCLPVAIFKMATTIPHKFNIVRFQRQFICG